MGVGRRRRARERVLRGGRASERADPTLSLSPPFPIRLLRPSRTREHSGFEAVWKLEQTASRSAFVQRRASESAAWRSEISEKGRNEELEGEIAQELEASIAIRRLDPGQDRRRLDRGLARGEGGPLWIAVVESTGLPKEDLVGARWPWEAGRRRNCGGRKIDELHRPESGRSALPPGAP
ncbi:hypothetical protein KM043_018352 [Ampulex compressa]|nr:hypothetical protein KM043_018352 [Ampulex compressa]